MSKFRSLRISVNTDVEIRTAEFNGQDHIVVPIVMMVGDSAINPMNSTGAEFVPSEVLAVAPEAWNGSPILPFHPVSTSGDPISANSPDILESSSFGQVFGAFFDISDNKLKAEAWLSPSQAEKVGPEAVAVIEILTGESDEDMAELSVGGFMSFESATGVANGKRYEVAWSDIKPDHLAIFSDGSKGACSNDLGCGAPRTNKEASMAKPGTVEVEVNIDHKSGGGFRAFSRLFRSLIDVSDNDLRRLLSDALRAEVPGFEFVEEVFVESGVVIFVAWPEDAWLTLRQSFTADEDGEITLADDQEQVEPVVRYEVVGAEDGGIIDTVVGPVIKRADGTLYRPEFDVPEGDKALSESEISALSAEVQSDIESASPEAGSCQCQKGDGHTAPTQHSQGVDMNIEELVGLLVANKSPYTDADIETLNGYDEGKLQALVDAFETDEAVSDDPAPTGVDTGETVSATPEEEEVELTEEEQIDALPLPLKSLVLKAQAQETVRREHLITALGEAQDAINKAGLTAKSTEDLEELSAVLGQVIKPEVDFSLASPTILRESGDGDLAPAPPSLVDRLTAKGAAN